LRRIESLEKRAVPGGFHGDFESPNIMLTGNPVIFHYSKFVFAQA